MQKSINFTSEKLEKNFHDFLQKRPDINELETDFEKKITFVGSLLFDDNGFSEIIKDGNSIRIGDFVLINSRIDFIWYDSFSSGDKHPIVFLKYFDLLNDKNSSIILDEDKIGDEIEESMKYCVNLVDQFKKFYNHQIVDKNIQKEIQCIDDIIKELSDNYNDKNKLNDFSFSLVFVFTNLNDFQKENIKRIINERKQNNKKYSKLTGDSKKSFRFFFENDIEEYYKKIISKKLSIENDFLEIDKKGNVLFYEEISNNFPIDKSMIVNISARSLKNLWQKYEKNLLNLNLRYYVKNKKIDDVIKNSMNSDDNYQFWFKNNGLVIVCENYKFEQNKIWLSNFSIVNGGQTTFHIGTEFKSSDYDDFFLFAKIISIKGMNKNPSNEVIKILNMIAESSNRQKAIKEEDLLVNRKEIQTLKELLEQNKSNVSITIKRGEIKPKNLNVVSYSVLTQILNAFCYIKPANSNSGKMNLFNEEIIKDLFGNFAIKNINTIIQLIKFNNCWEQELRPKGNKENSIIKFFHNSEEFGDHYKNNQNEIDAFFSHCKFFSLSILRIIKIFMCSDESRREYEEIINAKNDDEKKQRKITNWSTSWWNKINPKTIFINDSENKIIKFLAQIAFEFLAKFLKQICLDNNHIAETALVKKNWPLYTAFGTRIIENWPKIKELCKPYIKVEINNNIFEICSIQEDKHFVIKINNELIDLNGMELIDYPWIKYDPNAKFEINNEIQNAPMLIFQNSNKSKIEEFVIKMNEEFEKNKKNITLAEIINNLGDQLK